MRGISGSGAGVDTTGDGAGTDGRRGAGVGAVDPSGADGWGTDGGECGVAVDAGSGGELGTTRGGPSAPARAAAHVSVPTPTVLDRRRQAPAQPPGAGEDWAQANAAADFQSGQACLGLDVSSYAERWRLLEVLSQEYIVATLGSLGAYRIAGERHTPESLISRFGIAEGYRKTDAPLAAEAGGIRFAGGSRGRIRESFRVAGRRSGERRREGRRGFWPRPYPARLCYRLRQTYSSPS